MGKHCIIGQDYEKTCEAKRCTLKDLCRTEHQRKQNNNLLRTEEDL